MQATSPRTVLQKSLFALSALLLFFIGDITSQIENQSPDRLVSLFESKLVSAGITTNIKDPSSLSQIIKWAKKNECLVHCSYWLEYNLEQHPQHLPLKMALADCYFSNGDWVELKERVSEDFWVYQEHLRLVYLAFSQRELREDAWRETWEQSIEAANETREKTKSLILFLSQWKKWDKELEALLWLQVEPGNPLHAMALNSLVKLYEMQNNPTGLLRINESLLEVEPFNAELLNNQILIHVVTSNPQDISQTHLDRFKLIADGDPKYQLTLALYSHATQDSEKMRECLQQIPLLWFEESGNIAYYHYLLRQTETPTDVSDDTYANLIEKGTFLKFEREYLLSVID